MNKDQSKGRIQAANGRAREIVGKVKATKASSKKASVRRTSAEHRLHTVICRKESRTPSRLLSAARVASVLTMP